MAGAPPITPPGDDARPPRRSLAERAAEHFAKQPGARNHRPAAPRQIDPTAGPEQREPTLAGTGPARPPFRIGPARLKRMGLLTGTGDRTRTAEEFRIIKRPLLARAFSRSLDRTPADTAIMVASARPGEGKTFIAINLAISIASEPDMHVVLIDADTRGRGVERALGLDVRRGLTDLAADESLTLSDVLVPTDIPRLSVLPAGGSRADATELLASRRMEALFLDLIRRYPDRVLVIDTPPLLASSEASVVALMAGQAVLVVERGFTSRLTVERSLEMLGECRQVHVVLNRTREAGTDIFGSYYPAQPAPTDGKGEEALSP